MRARNLKPAIFKNELLAVADPLFTLIFEGLWCMADREGRLEDRPFRIHLEVNPGRSMDGTVQALDWLSASRFIVRYEVGGQKFISIPNFRKHQQPHVREPASKIPPPQNQEVVEAPDKHSASTGPARLNPDSGLLTPDSGYDARTGQAPDWLSAGTGHLAPCGTQDPDAFDSGWLTANWPETANNRNSTAAIHCAQALVSMGLRTWGELRSNVLALKAYHASRGDPSTVPGMAKYFRHDDPERYWEREWPLPKSKAEARRDVERQRLAEADALEWQQLRTRAAACDFRQPADGESIGAYRTLLERHEDVRRDRRGPQPITVLLAGRS